MAPWIANRIMRKCTALKIFHFTSDFHRDSDITKLQWYNLLRRKFAGIEFSDQANEAIEQSIATCSIVQLQVHIDWARCEIRDLADNADN